MSRRITACLVALAAALTCSAPAAARPNFFQPPPPPPSSASCLKQVTFALVDARTNGCLTPVSGNSDTWDSTDTVKLNGIPLKAFPGTKLVLKGPSSDAPGGSIGVRTKITLAGVTVFDGGFDYKFPAGGPGELKPLASLSAPGGTQFKGFSLGGTISVQLGKDATGDQQGYARFELIVKLPDVFRGGPGKDAGGLTGSFAIRTDASGVHADTLKIEIANAYVGQVLLKNVCISYVSSTSPSTPCSPPKFGATQLLTCETTGTDRWDGSALIQLPTADKPDVGVFAGTSNGAFAYAGAQVTNLGTAAPLAPGVYLDKVGLAICLNPSPMKIKGSVGIRFGPDFNGTQAAYLNGSIQYTDTRPWVLEANGSLSLFNKQVASGYFTYRSDGAIDFGFDVSWNFYGVLDLGGGVNGWYQPTLVSSREVRNLDNPIDKARANAYTFCVVSKYFCSAAEWQSVNAGLSLIPRRTVQTTTGPAKFDVFGSGRVCVIKILCIGGEVAVSSVGAAGCAEATVFGYPEPYLWGVRWVEVKARAGAGYRWGNGSHVDVMGQSCDVGSYRASKSAVIAAGGITTVRLDRAPATVVKITGLGRAPNVALTAPDGRRIVADSPGQLKRNKYFYLEDPQDNGTSVLISDPAPGVWRIRTLPGSSTVIGVSQAPVSPGPDVRGRVIGSGSDRTLEYADETAAGLTVTFWERGANYEQQLGLARGTTCLQGAKIQGRRPANAFMAHPRITCGVIPFAPAPGPAGVRNIVAVVTDHGEPVNEFKVASYHTNSEALPARPRNLHIHRNGSTVAITWSRSAGAYDYDVDVALSDGTRLLDVSGSRARHVVLHGISRRLTVTVVVVGLRADDVQGPSVRGSSRGR